ncbi:N-acetylglucosamine kinase [Mycolicibacterium sp. S2-37]|uniref:N-acetylglucosamine kinase n=1 Tax=Mycolicibacterium sp. S2-37 TaxID=2810297 RepID=UPI001F5F0297|nr:BadF/BadG/BcrA/BcrD ATPase family protein [Mycolicibacterium sp. S2-37]
MARYLGVDGGGSKTAFALIDDSGQVQARAQTATSYYFTEGFGVVENVLREGITEICRIAGIGVSDVDAAFFGIPGYGESSVDIQRLDAVPGSILGHDRYSCDNDMVCGWAGSLAGEDGINVISGTGSMTYGQRCGVGHRVGGWGELFGDEGSAYWIAIQGLNVFSRMSDGRLERSALYERMRDRLQITSDLDAVSLIIERWSGNRSAIADLARTVAAAAADDPVAERILRTAVDELAALVETTRRQLGFADDEPVAVSYSGGMFTDERYLGLFRARLEQSPVKYDLRRPLLDPALGAALYAAKQSGHPLTPDSLADLTATQFREEVDT